MVEEKKKWNECLQLIRENLKDSDGWIYRTWFEPLILESRDEQGNTILLQVPDIHVYDFLEHYYSRLLQWAAGKTFGQNTYILYRIPEKKPTFADIAEYLSRNNRDTKVDNSHIAVPDSKQRVMEGLRHALKTDEYQWIQGYDGVAEWLTDNKGRGLLIIGTTGLGKTIMCRDILPVILSKGERPVTSVTANELHDRIEELKKEKILIIDDLGQEPRKYYGNTDNSFYELCNNAERNGNILIISTSLSTTPMPQQYRSIFPMSIEERYGKEVLDRLKVITKPVGFAGESMRK